MDAGEEAWEVDVVDVEEVVDVVVDECVAETVEVLSETDDVVDEVDVVVDDVPVIPG